jgi:hypothetical protein
MSRAFALVLFLLAACASPSPEFFGVPEQRVVVDGTNIAVFRKGSIAQAIRLDTAGWGDLPLMRARLLRAVEQATGCAPLPGTDDPVHGVRNDPGVLTVRLECQALP